MHFELVGVGEGEHREQSGAATAADVRPAVLVAVGLGEKYRLYQVDISGMTKKALEDPAVIATITGGRAMLLFDPILNLPNDKLGDTPALAALAVPTTFGANITDV